LEGGSKGGDNNKEQNKRIKRSQDDPLEQEVPMQLDMGAQLINKSQIQNKSRNDQNR
jgi:hypothetical protein